MSKLERQPLVGKYKPYPEYKDSGVEWLGKIPSHWAIKKIAWYFKAQKGRNAQMLTKEFCGENPGDFPVYSGQTENDGVMGSINSYEFDSAQDGCLFATTVGAKAMTLSFLKGKFSLSQNCMVITPTSDVIDTRYYFYHCQPLFSYERGLIPEHMQASFRMEDLYQYQIAMPNLQEQQTIAAFLDYETARIDRLIAQQQRLIELLKEKRQAVISHAVTKGLNPNAPMKDSGVEWLGQVPEHWVVTNLKYVFDSLDYRRIPLSAEQRGERQGDYPYYGASGVIDGVDDYLFDEECVLVGEDGANLIMRSTPLAFVVSGKYWVNNHAHILRMHDGLNRYWAAVINNVDIKPIVSGSAQPKLTAEALGNIKVAFPQDTTEREELLIHINAETPKFDELIGHANQQVILLKERRSALISAAVTGKIDLRGWTPPAEEVAA
ncbi:restriction endonuclease subunit S [Aeromonas caviae]|uniref:restriction endonuclease subunit S n=1 Tax=Aeromonas caviae TaxID=648 RepID=UPI00132224ED|nr:restriction endonuclease subunit S [Aeromonas caviae]MXQ69277.1 restriction endonuclease subunit S [Aeromonas caviae]